MPWFCWAVALLCACHPWLVSTQEKNFLLGVLGPVSPAEEQNLYLAAVAAFDLDFRRNHDEQLQSRLGQPSIIHIPNLDPSLRIQMQTGGTSDADPQAAMSVAWDMLQGNGAASLAPHAIVSGSGSETLHPLSTVSSLYKVPLLSWAAGADSMGSDRQAQPFFLRTRPLTRSQGQSMWAWVTYYAVPSLSFVYGKEPVGEGLFQTVMDLAASEGRADHVIDASVTLQAQGDSQNDDDMSLAYLDACRKIQQSGTRFVLMGMGTVEEANHAMYWMEQEQMLYGNYQILGSTSLIYRPTAAKSPSNGLPVGAMKLTAITRGPLHDQLLDLWRQMTVDDVYGAEATERYGLDQWQASVHAGNLTTADFFQNTTTVESDDTVPFIIDSLYALAMSVNHLLVEGLAPSEIKGDTLASAIQNVSFQGISGQVAFDLNGNRNSLNEVWNVQMNSAMVKVGHHDSKEAVLTTMTDPYWAGGIQSAMPPSSLLTCLQGFIANSETGVCERCKPGFGCGYRASDGFPIGALGPFTSNNQQQLAAVVAFDLDMRKHFEPEIRARFGPPVVNISNLNPQLRVKLQIGNTDGSDEVALNTALDWYLGNNGFSQIVGMIGPYWTGVAMVLASSNAVFKVPQVAFSGTGAELSDTATYPYFTRISRSSTSFGFAFWKYARFLSFPQMTSWYTREPWGEGVNQGAIDAALADGESFRIFSVDIVRMSPSAYDLQLGREAFQRVKDTGSRCIGMSMVSTQSNSALYVVEQEGLIDTYQFVAYGLTWRSTNVYRPQDGLPVGLATILETPNGPLFPRLREHMGKMTPEDIYGPEAVERYKLDKFKVPLSAARAAPVTQEKLANPDHSFVSRCFDSGYMMVIAINTLLNKGYDPTEIYGDLLMEELVKTEFEGASGAIKLDSVGDRLADFDVRHQQPATSRSVTTKVGVMDAETGQVTLTSHPYWPGGVQSEKPPASFFECLFGFIADTTTGVCEPCKHGVGCGYRASDGFPLGFVGPITSFTQDHLAAAVAFDLDFRKNVDPDVRARFGAPVVNISNLDPRLRIKLQIGTSDSNALVGMNTALDWFLGNRGMSQVAGVIGGYDSDTTAPIASNAAVFEVPQVAWGATSSDLADKSLYPFLVRTSHSDSLEGQAMWAWMRFFGVPAVSFFYSRDSYGESLFGAVRAMASDAGESQRLTDVGVVHQPRNYDLAVARTAVALMRGSGTKFVIMAMSSIEANAAMYVMEEEDMLDSYQILASGAISHLPNQTYSPQHGLPVGFQKFVPKTRGRLFPKLAELWTKMSTDDVYGSTAVERYMLDSMQVPLSSATSPRLTGASFADPYGADSFCSMIFDAGYTLVIAINNLLISGLEPTEIYGPVLMEEVKKTNFEGVSGIISFDEVGDRSMSFELWNWQPLTSQRRLQSVGSSSGGLEPRAVAVFSANDADPIKMLDANSAGIYWIGGSVSLNIPEFLASCDAGKEWDDSTGSCKLCANGFFSPGGYRVSCSPCPAGSTSMSSRTSCIPCEKGLFSAFVGDNCSACPKGSYGPDPGLAACVTCPVGTFADVPGLVECKRCGIGKSSQNLWTTMSSLEVNNVLEYAYHTGADSEVYCGCDRGSRNQSNECTSCGEGMVCRGMGTVEIEEGYYSGVAVSVFKCHGDTERCVGGLPGFTCAAGRTGKTCSECEDGKTPGDNGTCKECEGSDTAPFVFVVFLLCAALVLVYHLIDTQNRVTQSHALLLSAIAVGQLVTVTQQLGVVGMLNVVWEEPLKSFMTLLSLLTFNIEVLRLNCVSTMSPVERYVGKVSIIFFTIAIMVLTHIVFVVGRYRCDFRARMASLIGSIGTLFMVFYISVTSTVLEPLQCQDHPNGQWTIRNYQGIQCWESDDHKAMLVVGAFAFFLVPVAYLVTCVWIVWQLPSRMSNADSAFLKAFSFLFFRFRAQRHNYALVQMMRSFLVASVLIIPTVELQVLALLGIVLAGYTCTIYVWPWRVLIANLLDCFFGVCTLMVVCVAALFIDEQDKNLRAVAHAAIVLVAVSLLPAPLAIVYGLYKRYGRPLKPFEFFLCHHKAASGAFTRLLKMQLVESGKVLADVFIDSDNLQNLDNLFDYVGSDTKYLCIVGTDEIFTRPWCVGEMCTAMLKKVKTMLLALESFKSPSEELINNIAGAVDNLEILIESGLTLEMLQDTLQWVSALPPIWVPGRISWTVMSDIVAIMTASEKQQGGKVAAAIAEPNALLGKRVFIIYDLMNLEAVAGSMVLQKMLNPHLAPTPHLLAAILDQDEVPASASICICMCTNGAFDRTQHLSALVQICKLSRSPALIPVLAEPNFQIPSKEFLKKWEVAPPAGLQAEDIPKLTQVIIDLFKQIACTFQPNHASDDVLQVGAAALSKRLGGNGASDSVKGEKNKDSDTRVTPSRDSGVSDDRLLRISSQGGSHSHTTTTASVDANNKVVAAKPPVINPRVEILL